MNTFAKTAEKTDRRTDTHISLYRPTHYKHA